MRFTIQAADGTRVALRLGRDGQRVGGWLVSCEGWDGTPAPREGALAASGRDGDLWPASLTQGARVVTLSGAYAGASTIDVQRFVASLAALAGQPLEILAVGPSGQRRARGYLSDDPNPQYLEEGLVVLFDLVVTCPDPRKYGDPVAFDAGGGKCAVRNGGNAPAWPVIRVTGRCTYLTASLGGRSVAWSGDDEALVIDFADMEPSSGVVTRDEAFAVPPGRCEIEIACNSGAKVRVEVSPTWK